MFLMLVQKLKTNKPNQSSPERGVISWCLGEAANYRPLQTGKPMCRKGVGYFLLSSCLAQWGAFFAISWDQINFLTFGS